MKRTSFAAVKVTLARDIKAARARAGFSQEKLALVAEVDRTYVSQLERGIANPSIEVLHRLAVALEMELKVLLIDVER